jgi:hypothetical protein
MSTSRFFSGLLMTVLLFANAAWAQDVARREALAAQIVDDPVVRAESEKLENAINEATARPVFKRLVETPGWGPENPAWKAVFPRFLPSFGSLMSEMSPDRPARLKAALAKEMTEGELAEVLTVTKDESLAKLRQRLNDAGMDNVLSLQLAALRKTPELYSKEEKELIQGKAAAARERAKGLESAKPEVEKAMQLLKSPAMIKYKTIVNFQLSEPVRRIETDASIKKQMRAFMVDWRNTVASKLKE